MNYIEKILDAERSRRVKLPSPPSMAIPHQAFSPREILAQFVRNDVQVLSHEPDDSVCVPDGYDGQEFVDSVQFFEDEFQARDAVLQIRDEIKLNKRKKNAENSKSKEVDAAAKDSADESKQAESSKAAEVSPQSSEIKGDSQNGK